jgi:hypothetical protein
MSAKRILLCTALAVGFLGSTVSANAAAKPDEGLAPAEWQAFPPLQNWAVDSKTFVETLHAQREGQLKAATDRAAVFRPVPICRLFDTRGFAAAIVVPGPIAPNTTTNITAAGACGIPNNGQVVGISLSFHVQNLTVNNGGFITFVQQGSPIAGTNAVFNPGAQWTAATANISIPNGSGNFAMRVANSQVHVIVDVNGYYQNLNELDVGTQELDINGNTAGDVFGVNNVGSGSALALQGAGDALRIYSGRVRAAGAGINTSGFAFIHQVNATAAFGAGGTLCGGFPAFSIMNHPMLNDQPNAIVIITALNSGAFPTPSAGPWVAYHILSGSCSPAIPGGRWAINDRGNAALTNGSRFSVMVITP